MRRMRFMAAFPLSNYESNFIKAWRHYIEQSESYYFERHLPKSAET